MNHQGQTALKTIPWAPNAADDLEDVVGVLKVVLELNQLHEVDHVRYVAHEILECQLAAKLELLWRVSAIIGRRKFVAV